jgi:NO-binding membrane sensor protein with MHYT domain
VLQVHQFSHGLLNPVLAYLVSVLGCGLGLRCTVRAQWATGRERGRWLTLGAASIGGTGIWVMHFVAMLGFSVMGSPVRYDIPRTLLSMVVAMILVGVGLFIVGFKGTGTGPLTLAGVVTGLGVATMHYLGMAALNMNGDLHYVTWIVIASVLIAVVAATAALWAALRVQGGWASLGAALVMGIAVTSMHYTGMAAVRVMPANATMTVPGSDSVSFLVPLMGGVLLATFLLIAIVAFDPRATPTPEPAPIETPRQSVFDRG